MTIDTKKAREMRAKGTAGPWSYDDGNVFSEPLQKKRLRRIMKRLSGEPIVDDDLDGDGEYPEGWICSTHQQSPSEDDDELIAYAVNNLLPMADEIDRLRVENEKLRYLLPILWQCLQEEHMPDADGIELTMSLLGDSNE